jgi:hypothetical protein
MIGADVRRREELLELAEGLSERLRAAQVPYFSRPATAAVGVPASTLAHATSYLARVRDLVRFQEFLARFEQLDSITAQNPDNPKADHRVVRRELEAFQTRRPDLSAEDLLYVLSWVGRLLPREAEVAGSEAPHPRFQRETPRPPHGRESRPRAAPPPARPPGEAEWTNVELQLWKGSPTVFRGSQTATCPKDHLPAPLLQKLQKLRRGQTMRVNARVVKKGGGEWRIASVEEI